MTYKAYFLESPAGHLVTIIAQRKPRKNKKWRLVRDRPLEHQPRPEDIPLLEKFMQVAFGAGVSYGRSNFN